MVPNPGGVPVDEVGNNVADGTDEDGESWEGDEGPEHKGGLGGVCLSVI